MAKSVISARKERPVSVCSLSKAQLLDMHGKVKPKHRAKIEKQMRFLGMEVPVLNKD